MAERRKEIAEAVRHRVMSGLESGTMQPGTRLPSARKLGREFTADVRSVTAAYRRLETEGLVCRQPPSRFWFVAPTRLIGSAPAPGAEWLAGILAGALARGVAVPDFPDHVRRSVETLRLRALCLECNRDQEVWLRRELKESFGIQADTLDVADADDPEQCASAVRSADLLVTTAAHAAAALRLGRAFDKPSIVVSLREDLVQEIRRLLAAGPLYFVGTDPRFADKLRRLYAHDPGGENLRPITLGRDDPATIPAGAPAYVMRTARDLLGGPPPQVNALATMRAFSTDTSKELLGFMIRENVRAMSARA